MFHGGESRTFSGRTSSRTHKHVRFPFIETWTAAESARKEQEEELKLGTLFRECFKEEDEEDEEERGGTRGTKTNIFSGKEKGWKQGEGGNCCLQRCLVVRSFRFLCRWPNVAVPTTKNNGRRNFGGSTIKNIPQLGSSRNKATLLVKNIDLDKANTVQTVNAKWHFPHFPPFHSGKIVVEVSLIILLMLASPLSRFPPFSSSSSATHTNSFHVSPLLSPLAAFRRRRRLSHISRGRRAAAAADAGGGEKEREG